MSWPDFRSVFYVLGTFLSSIAVLMLLPGMVDALTGNRNWSALLVGTAVSGGAGGAMILAFRTARRPVIGRREGFLLTTLSWLIIAAFSAVPFVLSDTRLSYTDAFFESMSGLTTTGSTVMTGLDNESYGILLWRSMLQWIGGIGIIVLAVMMLPFLRVGGMQLFRTESSDKSDKIRARASEVTWEIFSVYAVLTLLCAVSYAIAGMSLFDAVCHAMTTLATGGFGTKDASIGFYQNPTLEWVSTFFMFSGGLTFTLIARAVWHAEPRPLLRDSQTHWYIGAMVLFIAALTVWQAVVNGRDWESALRSSAFNLMSVATTTGYASEDYMQWGTFPITVFMVVLFLGACSGSTSGGVKLFRYCILGSFAKWQIRSLVHQHRVLLPTYNGVPVTDEIVRSVISFMALYVLVFVVLGLGVSAFGIDMVTAFSGVAQAMANIGPGVGPIIGPAGNFTSLPDGAKWLLTAAMLVGRLELLTVLVLFTPTFWRG